MSDKYEIGLPENIGNVEGEVISITADQEHQNGIYIMTKLRPSDLTA